MEDWLNDLSIDIGYSVVNRYAVILLQLQQANGDKIVPMVFKRSKGEVDAGVKLMMAKGMLEECGHTITRTLPISSKYNDVACFRLLCISRMKNELIQYGRGDSHQRFAATDYEMVGM